MKRQRTQAERMLTAQRMTPGAAGGRTPLVAPEPQLPPLGSLPVPPDIQGVTGATILYGNAGQTVASGSAVVVTQACWPALSTGPGSDSVALDGGSLSADTTNGRLTVVTAGTFLVGAQIEWPTAGGTYRYMDIQRHGTGGRSSPLICRSKVASAGTDTCHTCIGLVTGGPGDYFFVSAGHDTGADQIIGQTSAAIFWAVGVGAYGVAG